MPRTNALEFRILGPLEVLADGAPVAVGGPKQRALLTMLLLSANRVVGRDRLIEELFAEQSPNSADHALRNQVSRLRKALAPERQDEPRLVLRAHGYLLRVQPGELDLERFERLVADGRDAAADGRPAEAARHFRAAEALWRGRPLADLELEPFVRVDVEVLEELRLAAVEERIDAELALGLHRRLVPELEAASVEHPYRERFRAQLMLALYRCGRQAEGLGVYRRTRELLVEQLGLEPSPELQQLERAILVQDPALEGAPAPAAAREPRFPGQQICPFKGLEPFGSHDAELFFGRERLVEELLERCRASTLMALIGPSASGKSSLVRAGLLPLLGARAVVVRPGERPREELARALSGGLPQVLAELAPGERVALAVDQFEEVFRDAVAAEERRAYIDALVECAWDPERRVLIVLALRADHLGRLAEHAELADLVAANAALIGPLAAGELRRAVEGPAQRAGLVVERELVDALVDDLGRAAGALPLLSTTLVDLWRERDGCTLTLAAYEHLGGVRGAVARYAETSFRSLAESERAAARRILLRLVSSGEGDRPARRRVSLDELDSEQDRRALRQLVDGRLVVADGETVELVHEALLEHWPRLCGWLDEDAEGQRLRRRLGEAAAEWDAGGRRADALYAGARLAAAVEWIDAQADARALNRLERAFLDESRRAAARELDRQRRTNSRLRALLAAAAVLLVAALAAGAAAYAEWGSARTEATAADAERIGAQALAEPTLDRSLLLAREGVNLDDSTVTQSNLLTALLRSPAATAVLRPGGGPLLDEALSPDGRLLAVRATDGTVSFFDVRTRRRIGPAFEAGDQLSLFGTIALPLHALAFSPDGRTLAIGSSTGNAADLSLVDARTHTLLGEAQSPDAATADVVFAPDGRMLYTGELVSGHSPIPAEVIVRRSAADGRRQASTRPLPRARLIGLVDGGRRLLVTIGRRRSLLLDARSLRPVGRLALGGPAAVSSDGDLAAFAGPGGGIVVTDLRTGARRRLASRVTGAVVSLAVSRDGGRLAEASSEGDVTVWNLASGRVLETLTGHVGAARDPLFRPDGSALYAAGADGSVIAWDLSGAGPLERTFRFSRLAGDASTAVTTAPSGGLVATSPRPGHVTIRQSRDLAVVARLAGPCGAVRSVAFSGDGRLIAAAGTGPETVVWDLRTGKPVLRLPAGPEGGSSAVAFSPDGRLIATAGLAGEVWVYERAGGRRVAAFSATGSLMDVDFAPDGKAVAAAGLTGNVFVWNLASHQLVSDVAQGPAIFALRFSPDGTSLAAGDFDGNVDFWNPRTGARVSRPLSGQTDAVFSVSFDRRGSRLLTASGDGELRLWDLASGKLIGAPLPGADTTGTGTFFPDGKHVIAAFSSGRAVIWDVDPASWAARACRVANRNLSRAEWRDFLPNEAYRRVCP